MKKICLFLFTFYCVLALPIHAEAQNNSGYLPSATTQEANGSSVNIIPAKSVNADLNQDDIGATHPAIKITPDKSEIIRLDKEAFTVVIGNPFHLSILADSSKRLILVPQSVGSTFFSVLDENGNVIMQRHVIISAPKENYVRVRRSCEAGADGCLRNRVYYCPDMCHEIIMPAEITASAASASGGSGDDDDEEDGEEASLDAEAAAELINNLSSQPVDQ